MIGQTNLEWTESLFLSKLGILQTRMQNNDKLLSSDVFEIFYGKSLRDNQSYHKLRLSNANLGRFHPLNYHENVSADGNFGEHLALNDLLKTNSENKYIVKTDEKYPSTGKASIWFWDTLLPFNLASIRDCAKLNSHDQITTQLLMTLSMHDEVKRRSFTPEESLNHEYSKNPGLFPMSTIKFLTGKPISQNNELFHFNYEHEVTNKNNSTSNKTINSYSTKREDYFDQFANAYILPKLNCLDFLHAGTQTEAVAVTQVLNLVCNRHLQVTEEYCCAQ